jgi:hypothetical protein
MNEMLTQQLVKDRISALLADAEQRRLAGLRPPREPLLRLRLTIEFQLGRWKLGSGERLQAG